MKFVKCVVYLAFLSFISFLTGRILPKKTFPTESFPFQSFAFEKNGKFYEKLKIRKWKDKLPDMSRIFPKLIPTKKLLHNGTEKENTENKLPILVIETCIAEITHVFLAVAGFICLEIWEGIGGLCVSLLYAVGNIPFIMIQRYNRPRLKYIQDKYDKQKRIIVSNNI